MKKLVYVVEDEEDIAKLIQVNLALEGFNVTTFSTGEDGYQSVVKHLPDLVLLDLMLPGIDGLGICRKLKQDKKTWHIPIIMVTAKGEDDDIVKGLELGADDYITKPFGPRVLVARVKSVFRRRAHEENGETIKIHKLYIHQGKHEALLSGKKIDLTPSEFQILSLLSRKPGWVFTRSQIVDAIRGNNYAVTDRTIDFQMVGLRKKLGDMGEYIETVRSIGYRFKE